MSKSHNWITLENPRNGKIQVRVCTQCGAMNLPSGSVTECNARSISRPMNNRSFAGWKQLRIAA